MDTGFPLEEAPEENSALYTGKYICSYMDAFRPLGYRPEQATRILLTHKHSDHSGEPRPFPNAKIHVNREEVDLPEIRDISNLEVPPLRSAQEQVQQGMTGRIEGTRQDSDQETDSAAENSHV